MIRRRTLAEQAAVHLIEGLGRGRWQGVLPGVNRLAAELGIARETVRAALRLVEQQGLLQWRGGGRARVIVEGGRRRPAKRGLRVALLLRERLDESDSPFQGLVLRLRHRLEGMGHVCVFPPKTQMDLGGDPARIIRMVRQIEADAWLVAAGSLQLLEWFAAAPMPALAIGGRLKGLPIASASRDPLPAFRAVFRELIAIGHRRITLISGRQRRLPSLSAIERTLQEEFAAGGIPFGDFNVPDWEPTPEGLEHLMQELFRVTPPTAIQISGSAAAVGVLSFLSRRGLRIPGDVSVICESLDHALGWHRPALAHFTADYDSILRRVQRWVEGVAKGRPDVRQFSSGAEFDPGRSIGPPKVG